MTVMRVSFSDRFWRLTSWCSNVKCSWVKSLLFSASVVSADLDVTTVVVFTACRVSSVRVSGSQGSFSSQSTAAVYSHWKSFTVIHFAEQYRDWVLQKIHHSSQHMGKSTLKNAGLKVTKFRLFCNPQMDQIWTDPTMGYFNLQQHVGLVILTDCFLLPLLASFRQQNNIDASWSVSRLRHLQLSVCLC